MIHDFDKEYGGTRPATVLRLAVGPILDTQYEAGGNPAYWRADIYIKDPYILNTNGSPPALKWEYNEASGPADQFGNLAYLTHYEDVIYVYNGNAPIVSGNTYTLDFVSSATLLPGPVGKQTIGYDPNNPSHPAQIQLKITQIDGTGKYPDHISGELINPTNLGWMVGPTAATYTQVTMVPGQSMNRTPSGPSNALVNRPPGPTL